MTLHPVELLRKKMRGGQPVIGTFMKTLDPGFVECAGYAGLDYVILDQEHGAAGRESLCALIRAAEVSGVAAIVRVRQLSAEGIAGALDLGAAGVQVPHVSTAADVRQLLAFARYAPAGSRGVCRFVRAAKYSATSKGEYFTAANRAFLVIQVEGLAGLANLDEILAEDGYDVVFVGPYDLSQAVGKIGQVDAPEVVAAVKDVLIRAHACGKEVGIFADSLVDARRWRDLGVRYLSYSVDVGLFQEKCAAVVRDLTGTICPM